jgi:hypothetical protein
VWEDAIAQFAKRLQPDGIKHPTLKVDHILNDRYGRAVRFQAANHGPGRGSGCIMMRAVPAASTRVPLARGRGQNEVVLRNFEPVCLVKVLAKVQRSGVVHRVVANCQFPNGWQPRRLARQRPVHLWKTRPHLQKGQLPSSQKPAGLHGAMQSEFIQERM